MTLRYDSSSPGLAKQRQTLVGVGFEPLGTASFRKSPPGNLNLGGVVTAALLVGSKLWPEQSWLGYLGLIALLAASVWNSRVGARLASSVASQPDARVLNN